MSDVAKPHDQVSVGAVDEKKPQFLAPVSSDSIEDEELVVDRKYEKALVRKLDFHLLPVLTLLYLLSFLDRSNGLYLASPLQRHFLVNTSVVGNARLEGLTSDLKMSMCIPRYLLTR
jgi:hypothetical protein